MNQIFCVTHWGHGGEGSGSTIVVAPNETLAKVAIRQYFADKEEGFRQCQNVNLLEFELLEDSHLDGWWFDTTESGVKMELHFYDDGPTNGEIIYVGFPVDEIANELDQIQAKKNTGRGVSCVQTLVAWLRSGDLNSARAVTWNEGDKIRNHQDVVAVLKRIGFWYEIDWSKFGQPDED